MQPQDWRGYHFLGSTYFGAGRLDEAAAMFTRVTELVPDGSDGFSNLGAVRLVQGRYPDAIHFLQTSLGLNPDAHGYVNLGAAYYFMGRYEDAAAAYKEADRLSPNTYDIPGNIGEALYWVPGKRTAATPYFRRALNAASNALTVNPQDATALAASAWYAAMLGQQKLARSTAGMAAKLPSRDQNVGVTLAKTYMQLDQRDEAIRFLQQAVQQGYSLNDLRNDPALASLAAQVQTTEQTAEKK